MQALFFADNCRSHERNHQGEDIGNQILFPDERMSGEGKVLKTSRLGGLLNFYHRDAA